MDLRRKAVAVISVATLALAVTPLVAKAQECTGNKPKGGRYSTSAELYFARAPGSEDKEKLYQQALEVLEQGFERQPDNPRNYAMAGQAYAQLNRFEEANAAFTKAEEMWSCYGGYIDTLRFNAWVPAFNRGVQYNRQGDIEEAVASYRDAWTVYAKLPQPMLQVGGIYSNIAFQTQDAEARDAAYVEAIAAYKLALQALAGRPERLSPEDQQEFARAAGFNLAQMLAFQERYAEAVEAYEVYLELDPSNVDAMANAAVVMVRASRQLEAQAEEMEEGPEKAAMLASSDSLRMGAVEYYAQLRAREDLEADEYHNIGLGLLQIDMAAEAAIAYTRALELEPYRVNSLEQLARAYFSAQNHDSLAVVAQVLVERYPLNLDNLALLANAYRELEQFDDALAVLERREALDVQVTDLELEGEEGVYTVYGYLQNLKTEPDVEVELQFDFYDDAGEIVATEAVTVLTPAQDGQTEFSVSTESVALISGFAYKRAEPAEAETGA
jgi:tetratricopeptide (TPR) repeat protein